MEKSAKVAPTLPSPHEKKICHVCGDFGWQEAIELCCLCGISTEHIYCMTTGISAISRGRWVCDECTLAIVTLHLETIMGETEKIVASIESTTEMVERLGKAFDELESHSDSSLHNNAKFLDVKEHFQNLEKSIKEKFAELEEKEYSFREKESKNQVLLTEREAVVTAKERDLLGRLQELKDFAVSAIAEARKKCKVEIPAPVDNGGSKENKVRTVANGDPNAPIPAPEENLPDNRSGGSPRPQLKQLVEQMDAKGLLKFISENQKHHVVLRKELSIALKTTSEPARLVLDTLEGFYPPDQPASQGDAALQALRRNCLVLIESMPSMLGMSGENPVSSEIKLQAMAIADDWKPKLAAMDLDASNGNSLEALAFLQLLTTFGIASDFDEDELSKLVLAVSRRRQAPEFCRSLGLTHKMPGVTEALVSSGRPLDAVHFAYAFNLTESFPPVPLLTAFLKGLGKSPLEDTGAADDQSDTGGQELSALRAIVRYIEDNKLQEEYPLGPLQKRVAQLKKERIQKGIPEPTKFSAKRPRVNAGYTPRMATAFSADGRQPPPRVSDEWVFSGAIPERFPYTAPRSYEPPSHASYGQQATVPRAYHFPDERVRPTANIYSAPSSYGSYMETGGVPTSSASHASYTSTGYQPAPSTNYGSYTGTGFQSSHQSFM